LSGLALGWCGAGCAAHGCLPFCAACASWAWVGAPLLAGSVTVLWWFVVLRAGSECLPAGGWVSVCCDHVAAKVGGGSFHSGQVIVQESDPAVALAAKDSSDCPRRVAVVNVKTVAPRGC
jgi:hypothetical protein